MRFEFLILFGAMAMAAAPPQRIVSTAPSFTETLYALGAGARVAAVSNYCHYPAEVEKLPRVGDYLQPNVEAIARLRPGLVLVHTEQGQTIRQLTALGIPVLALRNTNLEEALRSAALIGEAIGMASQGRALEARLRQRLQAVRQAGAGRQRRTLLFIVGRTPGRLDGMIAVGKGSYLNELIAIAGGRNILDDSPVTYPKISLETVLRRAPDVIVDMGDMTATAGVTEAHKRSVERMWETATGRKNIHAVAADIFVVPGPRVVEAAEAFAAMLHGGAR